MSRTVILPDEPVLPDSIASAICEDYDRFSQDGLPKHLEAYLLDRYGIDVHTQYAGLPVRNPWGKASGQLSMRADQVRDDVDAGLGFVVLKTVIAQDEYGTQSMEAWAVRESRMDVERITGQSGEAGWTITWKGRGWWLSFDDYLQLIRDAQQIASGRALIVPSCKYHIPAPGETSWNVSEYKWTTPRLFQAWNDDSTMPSSGPMPIEMDFSPTLAGSDRASTRETILDWLQTVPKLIRDSALDPAKIRVGLKLFNAIDDDEFQLKMLDAIHDSADRCEFYVYGNRLFSPERMFDGHRGVAYGGPDLSDRNLRVMHRFAERELAYDASRTNSLPWSATGNIASGRTALEYALCGASSFQLHTFFQLPLGEYAMRVGNRTERALHELYFHPQNGFIAWMHHLAEQLELPRNPLRFESVIGRIGVLRAK